ncbi:hypothetical protein LOZ58_000837 [Ophidiomyces ophidiicola]|nr:hypothetical protein LOZ58_000837 [Ophidiomyces ophidiicola]
MRHSVRPVTQSYSPLKIRATVQRIRVCTSPWSTFIFIVWPFPLKYSLPHPLLSVQDIEKCPTIHDECQPGIRQLYNIPIYRMRDTPLRSLYRLYEDICASVFIMYGDECTYFFHHSEPSWSLASVPDPQDKDPVRYAFVASMVEALVESFNWRLEVGIRWDQTVKQSKQRSSNFTSEKAPSWTSDVTAVARTLVFCEAGSDISGMTMEKHFLKRNTQIPNGYLYTV